MTSWVIVNKKTGRKIFETYSEETANEVREHQQNTLEVFPIELWLALLSERKAEDEAYRRLKEFELGQ